MSLGTVSVISSEPSFKGESVRLDNLEYIVVFITYTFVNHKWKKSVFQFENIDISIGIDHKNPLRAPL